MIPIGVHASSRVASPASTGIEYVGVSSAPYAPRSNTSVTKPTGVVAGDFIILTLFHGQQGSYRSAPTPPAGFAQITSILQIEDFGGFRTTISTWRKFVESSEPASWTFTHPTGSTNAVAIAYRGVNQTQPLDMSPVTTTGTGTTITWPSITTVAPKALLVAIEWDWADTTDNTLPPSGYTERLDMTLTYIADRIQTTPGPSGTITHASNSVSINPHAAMHLALRPA